MEIIREDIHITETLLDEKLSYVTEADIIVPDTMPDVIKVLKTDIDLRGMDKRIHQGGVEITGTLEYKILYLAEDKTVKAINHTQDFNRNVDTDNASEDMICYVKGDITHIEPKINNSRKLNIKAVVTAKIKLIKPDTISAVAGFEGDNAYPLKTQKISSFNLNICKDTNITVEDILDLNVLTNGADEILKMSFSVKDTELKAVTNKAVARGNILLQTLYGFENEIMSFEYEMPFSEIIDADGLENDMYTIGEYSVSGSSYDITDDGTMNVRVNLNVNIRAYDEKSYETVLDTYSPDYELEIPVYNANVSEMIDTNSIQTVVKDNLITEKEIEKVYLLSGKPYVESVKLSGNKAEISGYIDASVMYRSPSDKDDMDINCQQKEIPFNTSVQISRSCDGAVCEYNVCCEGENYTLSSENSCDLRFVLRSDVRVLKNNSITLITDVICDEDKKTDKSNQAGIIVYFVQPDDTLWNIAKHYHTTDKQILSVNGLLDSYEPKPGDRLVIPKMV